MGLNPIQPNNTQVKRKNQNNDTLILSKKLNFKLDSVKNGKTNKTPIANARTTTPASLSGIERKIA